MGVHLDTIKRVIPALSIEMLAPMGSMYFSGTYIDFGSWIFFLIILDINYPNVLPTFRVRCLLS